MIKVRIFSVDQDRILVTGTDGFTYTAYTGSRFNQLSYLTTAANNDEYYFLRYFPKSGTYKVRFIYVKDTDKGKIDLGVNLFGQTKNNTNIASAIDAYAGSTSYINVYESIVTVARGLNQINVKVNGKNASSSGYRNIWSSLFFDLIAEHPVVGEKAPTQINQGSMVLLAKHKAEVAESTKTFNLADIDLKNKYAYLIVKARGQTTLALSLQMKVNTLGGALYHADGERNAGGTATQIDTNTATVHTILSSSILTVPGSVFTTETIVEIDPVGNYLQGKSQGGQLTVGRETVDWGYNSYGAITNSKITSIEVLTSTSTWKAGTIIEVYGVRKA